MRRKVHTKKIRAKKTNDQGKNEKVNMTKGKNQKKKKKHTAHEKLDQKKVGSLGTTIQKRGRTSLGGGTRRILR